MIRRRRFLLGCGALGVAGFLGWRLDRDPRNALTRRGFALGTDVTVTVHGMTRAGADRGIAAAFAALDDLEDVLSLYRPGSQLRRLNCDGALDEPNPHLLRVLRRSQAVADATGGALDVTVQPLWSVYAAAARRGEAPSPERIEEARSRVDWRQISVTQARVGLGRKGMALTLNGIAQGYACDVFVETLRAHGVEHALIDAGEIGALGERDDGLPWTVGIQHPRRPDALVGRVRFDGRALATSGDYATRFGTDGQAHHVFDPHTGKSPIHLQSVTVAAPTSMDADALSTALFVLGPRRGLALLGSLPDMDAHLVLAGGDTIVTEGFPRVEA